MTLPGQKCILVGRLATTSNVWCCRYAVAYSDGQHRNNNVSKGWSMHDLFIVCACAP